MQSLCAVMLGGSLGAALRWGLSATMNHRWSAMPLGTWLANLLGGFLVGVAVVHHPANTFHRERDCAYAHIL